MSPHQKFYCQLRRRAARAFAAAVASLLALGGIAFAPASVASEQTLITQCRTTLKAASQTAPMHSDFADIRVSKSVGAIDAQLEAVMEALSDTDISADDWAALEQCRSDLYVRRVELEERIAVLRTQGPVRVMTGAEVKGMLTDVMMKGEQNGRFWTQMFNSDGSTSFSFGRRISDGRWKIEADDYCSKWPPSEVWECWKVETRSDGIAFVSRDTGEVWPAQPYIQ